MKMNSERSVIMDNFSALLQLINPDNTMSINRFLAHSIGMAETIIYSALISKYTYYRDNGKASDGWFYSTIEDLQESTTYGRKVQSSAINKLTEYGLLESKLMGMPAKRYFRLISDTDKLEELIEKGQGICANMRQKNETEVSETTQNSSLSDGTNKFVPNGQTRLSQTDKQDCPDGTNMVAPMGQAYINLKGNNLKGNQSINPAPPKELQDPPNIAAESAEKKKFSDILAAIGYDPANFLHCFAVAEPESEEEFAAFSDNDRQTAGCIIPYGFGEKDMAAALRFVFGYSYYSEEMNMDFLDLTLDVLAEMACAEKTKIQGGYILGRTVIDKINSLIHRSELSECLLSFKEKWDSVVSDTKLKNPKGYMKSTLLNWLSDYKLEEFRYAVSGKT